MMEKLKLYTYVSVCIKVTTNGVMGSAPWMFRSALNAEWELSQEADESGWGWNKQNFKTVA